VRKGKWLWRSLTGDEGEIIAAEQEVGRDLAEAFINEMGADPDEAMRRTVRRIGRALSERVADRRRSFHFHVVTNGEPNAFALPGGYVLVTRSMIDLVGAGADETAFILGHEMGHVIKHHPMERIMSDAAMSAAMRTLRVGGMAGQWVRSTGLSLMRSAYAQDRELLADKLGAKLAMTAGFDPEGAIRMFEQLARRERAEDAPPLGEYFATHPPFGDRIGELRRFIEAQRR